MSVPSIKPNSSPSSVRSQSPNTEQQSDAEMKSKQDKNASTLLDDQLQAPHNRLVSRRNRVYVFDGSFEITSVFRDLGLDLRRSVQNGTRCVRNDRSKNRYMFVTRTLRAWRASEARRIRKRFKSTIQAQNALAQLTPFIQSVIAAKIKFREIFVVSPLPANMYLCDIKKLVVHLPHSTIRYYASCVLLGLEFLRHGGIHHGNLSLSSIGVDHYGRPQITDFDVSLYESIGNLSHQLEALRFAALLGILHCDNVRHFSISHMHCNSPDPSRKDLFSGICSKCRLSAECIDPQHCDCKDFGSLVRLIMSRIVSKEAIHKILSVLSCSWLENDLRYSWSQVPRQFNSKPKSKPQKSKLQKYETTDSLPLPSTEMSTNSLPNPEAAHSFKAQQPYRLSNVMQSQNKDKQKQITNDERLSQASSSSEGEQVNTSSHKEKPMSQFDFSRSNVHDHRTASPSQTDVSLPGVASSPIAVFGMTTSVDDTKNSSSEFPFDGYQQMMQHRYFQNTNWDALETTQSPEGFWFTHSLVMQGYTREAAPPKTNEGDDSDQNSSSYFTCRSRILYHYFG